MAESVRIVSPMHAYLTIPSARLKLLCLDLLSCAPHGDTVQVLDALPELGSYEIRLGHTQILAAAIAGMCLPAEVGGVRQVCLLRLWH